jgi:hypothetical protein
MKTFWMLGRQQSWKFSAVAGNRMAKPNAKKKFAAVEPLVGMPTLRHLFRKVNMIDRVWRIIFTKELDVRF